MSCFLHIDGFSIGGNIKNVTYWTANDALANNGTLLPTAIMVSDTTKAFYERKSVVLVVLGISVTLICAKMYYTSRWMAYQNKMSNRLRGEYVKIHDGYNNDPGVVYL